MSFQPQRPELNGVERRLGPMTAHRVARLRAIQGRLWSLFEDPPIKPELGRVFELPGMVHSVGFDAGRLWADCRATSWEYSYQLFVLSPEGIMTCTNGFGSTYNTAKFDPNSPNHRRQLKAALGMARLLEP